MISKIELRSNKPNKVQSRSRSVVPLCLLLGLSLLMFTGCASKQALPAAKKAPSGASRVVLVRQGSMVGGIQKIRVYDPGKIYEGETLAGESKRQRTADGSLVGVFGAGGKLTWDRAPGPMLLTLELVAPFGRKGDQLMLAEINTEGDKEYTVELGTLLDIMKKKQPKITERNLR